MTKSVPRRPQAEVIAAIRQAFKGYDIWNNKRVKGRTLKIAVVGANQGDRLRTLIKILNKYGWGDVKPVFKQNVNTAWNFFNSDSILIRFPLEDSASIVATKLATPARQPALPKASKPKKVLPARLPFPMTKEEVLNACTLLEGFLTTTEVTTIAVSQPCMVPAWTIQCFGKDIIVKTLGVRGNVLKVTHYPTTLDLKLAAGLVPVGAGPVPKGVWPNVR